MSDKESQPSETIADATAQVVHDSNVSAPTENDAKAKCTQPARRTNVHKKDWENDIVYVYQFTRTPLIPSLSPFCLKLETWLRLSGIKYENVDHKLKFKSHKRQLPFVELNGQEIADSAIIIKELGQKFGVDLDASLTSEQRITSHTAMSMIENHLFWVLYYFRASNPNQFLRTAKVNIQRMLGSKWPNSLLNSLFKWRLKQGMERVKGHGLGVHSSEEIQKFGIEDLQVLSDLLKDKPYFFGSDPTLWMQEHTANLIDFVHRMKALCYPDWDQMCTTLELNTHLTPKESAVQEKIHEKEDGDTPQKNEAEAAPQQPKGEE